MAYDPKRARKARKQVRVLRRRVRRYRRQERQSKKYDPLAPLTGPRLKQERKAAEKLTFGPRRQELNRAIADQEQTTADRATYYDDWKQQMREAAARVNEANRQNVEATEARVDKAHAEDTAGQAARDAAASEQAAKLGRGPVSTPEATQAISAQRSQGNQAAASLRGQAAADTKLMELRGVNAGQAKLEDQARMAARRGKLRGEEKELASERGAFRADFRRKAREDERQWSAIQTEFGLTKRGQNLSAGTTRTQRQLEAQKLRTQKIVARIYASADKAGARSQIRVARIQLKGKKISKKQYREIVNIYKGLPEKGKSPAPKDGGKPGPGSGPGGSLAPWERSEVSTALNELRKHKVKPGNCRKKMRSAPTKPHLHGIVCRRYSKNYGPNLPENLPSYPSPNG